MSSKNLKVYKIHFLSEIKTLNFKVKFPCQIKVTWKRSNQHAETKLVALQNYQAHINQTLKLNINMYYDTTTSKFVEKKCIYNVLIITEKGQKAAGSISYDLAEFFNKRIYEIDQQFPLQKCPVQGTTLKMKIYYEQSTEAGYDSMSKISMIDNSGLDLSGVSMNEIESLHHDSSSETKSKKSEVETEKTQKQEKNNAQDDKYPQLNQSAVEQSPNNMKQKIQAVADVTLKIEHFVEKISTNLKYQIEALKRKNQSLQQQALQKNSQKQLLTKQLTQLRVSQAQIKKQYNQSKDQSKITIESLSKTNEQLKLKLKQSEQLCNKLQSNMNQKGQSQASYIQELKNNFIQRQNQLKKDMSKLQQELQNEKKIKNQFQSKNEQYIRHIKEMKQKHRIVSEKNSLLQDEGRKRQQQLEKARINLDKTYQKMIKLFGEIV